LHHKEAVMLNSQILEVAIGLIFVYLLFSLICSMFNEWFARVALKLRASTLLDGINSLINDPAIVYNLYRHPLINSLAKLNQAELPEPPETLNNLTQAQRIAFSIPDNAQPDNLGMILKAKLEKTLSKQPSYIPARTFALALIDQLAPAPKGANVKALSLTDIRGMISNLPDDQYKCIKQAVLPLLDAAKYDLEKAYKNIEKWFDDAMDRVSGWYKRHTKWWLCIFAAIVCLAMNVDTFAIANSLYRNDALRSSVVAVAEKQTKEEGKAPITVQDAIKQVQDLKLPIGWVWEPQFPNDPRYFKGWEWFNGGADFVEFLLKILGLIFSIMAVSMGAPFWFDLLNKLVNLRGTGNTPAPATANSKPQ
jgi:hypothetical protein